VCANGVLGSATARPDLRGGLGCGHGRWVRRRAILAAEHLAAVDPRGIPRHSVLQLLAPVRAQDGHGARVQCDGSPAGVGLRVVLVDLSAQLHQLAARAEICRRVGEDVASVAAP
jgi:hypothetical protein